MAEQENITVMIDADMSAFDRALNELQKRSNTFGSSLTTAMKDSIVSGKQLDDVLRQLASNMASMALNSGLKPLQGVMSGLFSGMLGAIGGVTPFAKGGVISSPTYFGMGGGLGSGLAGGGIGLAGEAGAEAILPLARGPDGRLGVATGGGGRGVSVVFNMSSPDATSFRKSEAQLTAMLAGAVRRGVRRL